MVFVCNHALLVLLPPLPTTTTTAARSRTHTFVHPVGALTQPLTAGLRDAAARVQSVQGDQLPRFLSLGVTFKLPPRRLAHCRKCPTSVAQATGIYARTLGAHFHFTLP